jgi:lipoprotein-anchoring transpeptidase ErfK/SrfK
MAKHRAPRPGGGRRGSSVLTLAVGATIVVGSALIGVLSQLDDRPAPASATASQTDAAHSTPSTPQADAVAEVAAIPPADPDALDAAIADAEIDPAVPSDSGAGRRIVFSESDQRVWLIDDDESVERTYLVSGSRFDNLDPGTYAVQSKNRHATAFDDSGTMQYFVRFATGFSEPIGFHSVPRDNNGRLEQTKAQLGTPLSAGCVRQWESDAVALWDFAPVGTTVVVTA